MPLLEKFKIKKGLLTVKKIFALTMIIMLCLTSAALAKKPVRIARLPIMFLQNKPNEDTANALEMKLARAVHIPLNETLQLAEYLPPLESAEKLQNIWQKMYAKNKKSMPDAVKTLAKDLNADIVVVPILRQYSQYVMHSNFNFESKLSSFVSAEMIIYDKRTDDLIDKKFSRSFNDNFSQYGTASYLAGECFDKLIKNTELRKIIHNIRN